MFRISRIVLIALVFAAPLSAATFIGLGDLPEGTFRSVARGTTNASYGPVVVGFGTVGAGELRAIRWSPQTGMVALPYVYGGSVASGVSHDGRVIVGGESASGYRWTQETGIQRLDPLPGGAARVANAISADGNTIVGSGQSTLSGPWPNTEPFIWRSGKGSLGLGYFPGGRASGVAYGVSADGSIVVGAADSIENSLPFCWTAQTGMVALTKSPGFASAISGDGNVILCTQVDDFRAYRWTLADGLIPLGALANSGSQFAVTASYDGRVIGGSVQSTIDGSVRAMIWRKGKGIQYLQDVLTSEFQLNLSKWTLRYLNSVSPDGNVLVGSGINPAGFEEAFVAIIPEPSNILLIGAGGFFACRSRRRSRLPG